MKHRQVRDAGELAEVRLPLVVAVDVGNDFLDAAVAGGFDHGARMMPTHSRGNPDLAASSAALAALAEQIRDRQRPGLVERDAAKQADLDAKLALGLVLDGTRRATR